MWRVGALHWRATYLSQTCSTVYFHQHHLYLAHTRLRSRSVHFHASYRSKGNLIKNVSSLTDVSLLKCFLQPETSHKMSADVLRSADSRHRLYVNRTYILKHSLHRLVFPPHNTQQGWSSGKYKYNNFPHYFSTQ